MRDSLLKSWLLTNNFLNENPHQSKTTHLFLDGGKGYVPYDKLSEFHDIYNNCIKQNQELFVVENKTDIFRLFSDLDFLSEKQIEYHVIIKIIKNIQSVITELYNRENRLIICDTDVKTTTKNKKECIKQGFHLFWPDIYTDVKHALLIRKKIINRLKLEFGEREFSKWEDVVDRAVYISNGIRMNKSYKLSNSKTENRKYDILTVLGPDSEKEIEKLKDFRYALNQTSIRTDLTEITKFEDPKSLYALEDDDIADDDEENEYNPNGAFVINKQLPAGDPKHEAIMKFFDENKGPNYKTRDIRSISYVDSSDCYIIKTKSKFCQNLNRNHNSCNIYFMLSKTGLVQKCFCRCLTLEGRSSGMCHKYSSPPIKVKTDLAKLLKWKIPNKKKESAIVPKEGIKYIKFLSEEIADDPRCLFLKKKISAQINRLKLLDE